MNHPGLLATSGPIEWLAHWAAERPEAIALIDHNGITTSYGSLWFNVQARAGWLAASGVKATQTVALSLPIRPDGLVAQVELLYAIAYLGATILPLYHDVPSTRWASLMAQFDAHWLASDLPLALAGGGRQLKPEDFDANPGQWANRPAPRGDDPDRPFLYEFTSGTTGMPKLVGASGASFMARLHAISKQLGWRTGDVMVPATRWPTKTGIRGLVRAHGLGATHVDEPFPETRRDLARLVNQLGVTCIGSSPWQLRRLLNSAGTTPVELLPLRSLYTAGAFIAHDEIMAVRQGLTGNFYVVYGTTEFGIASYLPPHDPPDAAMTVFAELEVQAISESGQPLAPGEVGRLKFRGVWIPKGYVGHLPATREGFHDGWFITNDFGSVDASGRLTLGGRLDDTINYGGTKIHPKDVEAVLQAMPDIADAALVGVPDAMAGELPVAFVVLRHSLTLADMHAYLLTRLDQGHMPVAIVAIRQIPRNPEGKILREPLRAQYVELADHRNLLPIK